MNWRLISLVAAVGAAGISSYLTISHYDTSALVCSVGDCHAVQSSRYSEIAGIPIALFGLGMYLTTIGLGIVRWRRPDLGSTITTLVFTMVLAAVVYFIYLTYLEIAVIHAICQWCVASAVLTVVILGAEGRGLHQQLGEPAVT